MCHVLGMCVLLALSESLVQFNFDWVVNFTYMFSRLRYRVYNIHWSNGVSI